MRMLYSVRKIRLILRKISLISIVLSTLTPLSIFSEELADLNRIDTSEVLYKVKWIGSFQSPDEYDKDKPFTRRIIDFIIGDENTGLIRPYALLKNSDQSLWVLDQGLHALVGIESDLKDMEIFPYYSSPIASCNDNFGQIYFTDSKDNAVYRFEPESPEPEIFNTNTSLNRPTGIAYSKKTRQLWVVETGAHRITILNRQGEYVKSIGKRGNDVSEFNFPTFITIDKEGNVFVVDSMNFRVQIFDMHGNFTEEFGSVGDKPGYFSRPKGIATDSKGNIYVVESLLNAVQVFNKNGDFLYIFGHYGKNNENFWMPTGIYIDGNDRIYLADSFNSNIQIFQLVRKDEKAK